jgi:hypothetical protein
MQAREGTVFTGYEAVSALYLQTSEWQQRFSRRAVFSRRQAHFRHCSIDQDRFNLSETASVGAMLDFGCEEVLIAENDREVDRVRVFGERLEGR